MSCLSDAEKNNIAHKFNKETKSAGKDWFYNFTHRHLELSLRSPKATSVARVCGFNKQPVEKFFTNLEVLIEKFHFTPNNIYNVDETGMTMVQRKSSKIMAMRSRLQVGSITSAERGQLITMEICMSVTGAFILLLFIFPRERMKQELMDGALTGSIRAYHKSRWM